MEERIKIAHYESYPMIKCQNQKCKMTFVLIAVMGNEENGVLLHQGRAYFCPYCGDKQEKKE